MTSSAGTPAGHGAGGLPRRVGRPPRIDRDAIARAVTEIGLDEVTVKRVADHLGVSVPGLYHHVRGRDDLLRLAAEHSLARLRLPEDRGQHWAVWLREWARYARAAFAEQPELLQQFVGGGINDDRVLDQVGVALDVLRRSGFDPRAAKAAFDAVGTLAVGAAVEVLRERRAAADGRPWLARVHANLARRDPDEQATLRELLADGYVPDLDADFEEQLDTVILGLAVRHGLPVDDEVRGTAGN